MAELKDLADQIRETGAVEFRDSNHAHEILTELSEIISAVEETLRNVAERVYEAPGIVNEYGDAATEAAGHLNGVADQVQERIGEGIVQS